MWYSNSIFFIINSLIAVICTYWFCFGIFREMLDLFNIQEIINWQHDIVDRFQTVLCRGVSGSLPTGVFDLSKDVGVKRWEDLKTRVMEHVCVHLFRCKL